MTIDDIKDELDGETGPAEAGVSKDEKTWGMVAHLAALSGWIGVPFGNILGPLVIYFVKKDESDFVRDHAKEGMNFGISVLIYSIVCIPLMFILIGFLLIAVVIIGSVVLNIIAGMKANEGRTYKYPYTIRLIS